MDNQNKDLTSISIPKSLSNKIKGKIEGTPFHTVSSYITFVMRLMILESSNKDAITKEDEENVKAKLKKLGYIG